ncbi:MAG: GNAT family N-acetyltransferase [Bellilinea sp.]
MDLFLQKDNLLIRTATPDDAPILCRWWNDGNIMAHAGFPKGIGTTIPAVIDNLAADNNHVLMLEIDAEPVGEMNYRSVGENAVEIGIKICNPAQQGKGYGTDFLKMLIEFLFLQMGYQKIILDTNLKNTRAQHVYENIGFRKGAVHLDSWKDQLGEWQSSVDYHLAREEYLITPG